MALSAKDERITQRRLLAKTFISKQPEESGIYQGGALNVPLSN